MPRSASPARPTPRLIRAALALAAAAPLGACAPGPDAGLTTVRSGSPGGPRVTSIADDDRAMRVSAELCQREATCGRIGERDDQRWRTEEACLSDLGSRLPAQLRGWTCSPAASRTRVDDCLAAIRSESCATALDRPGVLPPCRASAVCPE